MSAGADARPAHGRDATGVAGRTVTAGAGDADAADAPIRAAARIAAARARLVLDHPFVGALALHLEP
ncbi:MAG: hypothetical protein MUF30_11925, partial [Burkholderiales bacterium]|nr:hypothetical protein [Burkholderiales bacterium]